MAKPFDLLPLTNLERKFVEEIASFIKKSPRQDFVDLSQGVSRLMPDAGVKQGLECHYQGKNVDVQQLIKRGLAVKMREDFWLDVTLEPIRKEKEIVGYAIILQS